MKGFWSVLFVTVALAASGCVSSTRTGTAVGQTDDGPGCYRLALRNLHVFLPDILSFRVGEDEDGMSAYVFEYNGEGEDESGEDVARYNRITVDFWVADGQYDLAYRLADHLRVRDEFAERAYLMEFSPVREAEIDGRTLYTYNISHQYSFDDHRLMRGRYALFPVADGRLYAAVSGIWEATRHEEMSPAFNAIAGSLEVEPLSIEPVACEELAPADTGDGRESAPSE